MVQRICRAVKSWPYRVKRWLSKELSDKIRSEVQVKCAEWIAKLETIHPSRRLNGKEKTMKRWIVTAVDYDTDGNCDGKARVLSVFKTHEEAKNYVDEDIKEWIDQREVRRAEKHTKKGLTLAECERRRIEAMKKKGLLVNKVLDI